MNFTFRHIGILYFVAAIVLACSSNEKGINATYDEISLRSFVAKTHKISEADAIAQLDSILMVTSKDRSVFRQTVFFLAKPFSDPNSPYRNQNLYSKLLQSQLQSQWYNSFEKSLAKVKIELLGQNNVGHFANDFTYTTPAGYKKKVYDIKANYLLLYFNNPECTACKQMKQALSSSNIIIQKQKSGELKILSIYTDRDEKLWLDHLHEYPNEWIQGRDENDSLYKHNVYDLRAIPTIYLLDANKKVLLKDCLSVYQIETALSH